MQIVSLSKMKEHEDKIIFVLVVIELLISKTFH